jgi:hypothetical protein
MQEVREMIELDLRAGPTVGPRIYRDNNLGVYVEDEGNVLGWSVRVCGLHLGFYPTMSSVKDVVLLYLGAWDTWTKHVADFELDEIQQYNGRMMS